MKHTVKMCVEPLIRQRLANPFLDIPMIERWKNAGSIDLRNNYIEELLPNGYVKIRAIDNTITYA